MTEVFNPSVVMCQIGAREHYAVARAWHQLGVLDHLVTDLWMPPGPLTSRLPISLRGRWNEGLRTAHIKSFNRQCLLFEASARSSRKSGWSQIMSRNQWFQDVTVRWLEKHLGEWDGAPRVVASYSYAASRIFFAAKRMGCRTIMFQIDPGPAEENILLGVERKYPALIKQRVVAPREYWSDWKLQCELADIIVANSEWSRSCLIEADVRPEKIRVIPLAYLGNNKGEPTPKEYPRAFTTGRPLRVLFLGQVNLRKGMGELLDAVKLLRDRPVEFWIAGQEHIIVPGEARANPQLKWIGQVPRLRIDEYYRDCDVFLFPTISDGFGLTQLEAQANAMPVIASRFCGDVVEHGRNGLRMDEVSAEAIVRAVTHCLDHPEKLREYSAGSRLEERFLFPAIQEAYRGLLEEFKVTDAAK